MEAQELEVLGTVVPVQGKRAPVVDLRGAHGAVLLEQGLVAQSAEVVLSLRELETHGRVELLALDGDVPLDHPVRERRLLLAVVRHGQSRERLEVLAEAVRGGLALRETCCITMRRPRLKRPRRCSGYSSAFFSGACRRTSASRCGTHSSRCVDHAEDRRGPRGEGLVERVGSHSSMARKGVGAISRVGGVHPQLEERHPSGA
jgi:hypothetical protein